MKASRRIPRTRAYLILGCVLGCAAGFGQTSVPPVFEVASVKLAPPGGGQRRANVISGGPGTSDPGLATFTNVTLLRMLMQAYNMLPDQIAGPEWLPTERYDIVVKVPPGVGGMLPLAAATSDQFNQMLRSLLTARFHMTVHLESKAVQGYELTVGKDGARLQETATAGTERPGLFVAVSADHDGAEPASHLTAIAQPLTALLRVLRGELHGPVVDQTGLTGLYDFKLEYLPGGGASGPVPSDPAADIVSAVHVQLGLKLERKKVLLDELVIDHADRIPVEN